MVEWAGVVGLVGIVAVWHLIDRADQGLYRGGLFVYALLSAAVILAAVRPRGPVHGLLAWRPLVYVGTISYGVYLIHWPIVVVLRQETSLPWQGILAVALVLTLVVATASYRWLERPVRARRWSPPPGGAGAGGDGAGGQRRGDPGRDRVAHRPERAGLRGGRPPAERPDGAGPLGVDRLGLGRVGRRLHGPPSTGWRPGRPSCRDGGRSPSREQPESDPARMEAYRQILAEVATRHSGRAAVVDLAAYMRTRDDDKQLRPDGVHFTEAGARKVAAWLGPEVARLYATAGSPPAR